MPAIVTSNKVILDELNLNNVMPKVLSEFTVDLVTPEADTKAGWNTKLLVKSIPGGGYFNQVEIHYNRIDLGIALAGASIKSVNQFTPTSILAQLNSAYVLFLTVADLEVFVPPILGQDEVATLTLKATADSRGFTGSVDIQLTHSKAAINSMLPSKSLPVRNHPDSPLKHKQSGRMCTWGIDFTSLRDSILPDLKMKTYLDWSTLQAACSYLGLPGWTQGLISDHATTDILDSNPAFDRVIVQSIVVSDYLIGPIYLHYNILEKA